MSEQDNATDFIQSSNKAREYENKKKNKSTKHKCTGWAIVATMERPDGTCYTDTITDIDDDTASSVDTFLTEYSNEYQIGWDLAKKITKKKDNNDT